jgi:formylglycine-generating enzyme required for sulfatase activity
MRSITALLALLIIVLSCGKRDQGELIGVKTKKFIRVNPHGMVEVPGGSFIMGSSDEDIIDAQNDITRTMTVRTFYMDETEITNREYMQFIEWVKDSIVRTKLAEKAVMVFEGMYEDNNYERGTTNVPSDDVELFYSLLNDPDELEETMPSDEQIEIAENQSLEDLYNTSGGEILSFYPSMEDFIGDPEEDLTSLNGYQQLVRFRAQNPVKLWLSTRTSPDSVFELQVDDFVNAMKNSNVNELSRADFLIYDAVPIYPDTTVWIRDFKYSYNEPMFNEYFWHPAYADYPVVGISWKQAKAFANWRTKYRNDYLRGEKNKTTVGEFRLPTEGEWEYAARGGKQSAIYPWGGPYLVDSRGDFLANFKPKRGDYAADNIVYTAEVDSYEPNDFGLYNMSGNVAEWTSSPYYNESYEFNTTFNPDVYMPGNERKVVRGGSWKDVAYFLKVGSRDYEYADSAKSYIGLRLVRDYLGSNSK